MQHRVVFKSFGDCGFRLDRVRNGFQGSAGAGVAGVVIFGVCVSGSGANRSSCAAESSSVEFDSGAATECHCKP